MKRTAQSIEERKSAAVGRSGPTSQGGSEASLTQPWGQNTVQGSGKVRKYRKHKRPNKKMSAKELANLRPFPKGVSGNPGGKPGTDLFALQARALAERHPISAEGFASLADELKGFNAYGFSVVADRGYGKVKETHEVVGEEGGPVEIVVKLIKA